MLIAYSPPDAPEWTLASSGSGQAWINDDDGTPLTNLRPALGARIQWLTGAQTTASYLELRAAWPTGQRVRFVAVLGCNLPAGTRIVGIGRPTGEVDFDEPLGADADVRLYQRARGERIAILQIPDTAPELDGIALRIYNDVDGSADIPADQVFDLAEVFIGDGHALAMRKGWSLTLVDTSRSEETNTGQRFTAVGARYWRLDAQPAFKRVAALYGDEASTAETSYLRLLERIDRGQPVLVIPRYSTAALLHESAIFGTVREVGPIKHLAGPYHQPEALGIAELPVPV